MVYLVRLVNRYLKLEKFGRFNRHHNVTLLYFNFQGGLGPPGDTGIPGPLVSKLSKRCNID